MIIVFRNACFEILGQFLKGMLLGLCNVRHSGEKSYFKLSKLFDDKTRIFLGELFVGMCNIQEKQQVT